MDKYKISSIIKFGNYDWRILDVKNNSILVITENIIEQRAYHNIYNDTNWAECELRNYLNNDIYNQFNANEKSKIISVKNKNPDNQWYGTKNGKETHDKLFLLNLEEVCSYFGNSIELLINKGNNRYWKNNDINNNKRLAIYGNNYHWWWIRSLGRNNHVAAYVHGTNGCVGINGNNITNGNGGVRPALYLKI